MSDKLADSENIFSPIDPSLVPIGDSNIVLDYWNRKCGDAIAPAWRIDFWLEELPASIISHLSVVDVIDGGDNYRYRFWGTAHTTCKGYDMTGKLLTVTPTERSIPTGYLHYGWVIKNKRPMAASFNPHFLTHGYPSLVTYRFPLSSDGELIDKIVNYQPLTVDREVWEQTFKALLGGKTSIEPRSF